MFFPLEKQNIISKVVNFHFLRCIMSTFFPVGNGMLEIWRENEILLIIFLQRKVLTNRAYPHWKYGTDDSAYNTFKMGFIVFYMFFSNAGHLNRSHLLSDCICPAIISAEFPVPQCQHGRWHAHEHFNTVPRCLEFRRWSCMHVILFLWKIQSEASER